MRTPRCPSFDDHLGGEAGAHMENEPQRDDRASEDPEEGADPEPTPGEDGGPMGNPAEDEEALRHEQEDAGGGDA